MATQLGPFEVGQIVAHVHHGLGAMAISRLAHRADGSTFSDTAIGNAMAKLEAYPLLRGEQAAMPGRPKKTTKALDRQKYREALKHRGTHTQSL